MSTTVKTGRAWIPATVATLLVVALAFGGGLIWETLQDQDVDALANPNSVVGSFVLTPLAPIGGPGIIGDADTADSLIQLGGGLVPVVVLVFLFTWIGARAARAGSSVPVLFGSWLGTVLGAGLGAVTSFEIFLRRNDLTNALDGLQQARVSHINAGLYWGAALGLVVALVALLAWGIASKPVVDEPDGEPALVAPPPVTSSFSAPGQHVRPDAPPSPVETVRAPESPHHRRISAAEPECPGGQAPARRATDKPRRSPRVNRN
jgi:hypothetical protein